RVMSSAEIAAAVDRYAAAILAGDRAALDELLDPGYQFVSAHAHVVGRERRLNVLAGSPQSLAAFTFASPDVRIVGDVAIVCASFTAEFQAGTGRAGPDQGITTLVFSRSHGRWRLRHQHNSHDS
ncbi:MAG TPA: nuclear transport factor 2 family protein, partial [Trebonia sp.]